MIVYTHKLDGAVTQQQVSECQQNSDTHPYMMLMCSKKFITTHNITKPVIVVVLPNVLNPFKPSGVKWLHYKVFKAILV